MNISQSLEKTRDRIKDIIKQPLVAQHEAELTSAEIAILWNTYMHYSMLTCFFKYFEKVARDNNENDIMSLISYALKSFSTRLKWITDTFKREKLTIPLGFSENDVKIEAPQLYSNSYLLYYLKNMINLGLTVHALNINLAARPDVRDFYNEIITTILELNKNTANLMLERGILPRHPYIPISGQRDITRQTSFFDGFIGEKRPLLAVEITHLYLNALINHIGRVLLNGFAQVAKSEKIREYMIEGTKISDEMIEDFTSILREDGIPTPLPWDASVTDSTVAPFSDKLMMYHVSLLTAFGVGAYGVSLAASPRSDLATKYAKIMANVGKYTVKGAKILMDNGWMEEPPQVVDYESLSKKLQ